VPGAFAEAVRSLHDLRGLKPGVRSLEPMSRTGGEVAGQFAEALPAPPAAAEGALVGVTADGKGVPMRRPVGERRPGTRRHPGETANQKPRAAVGAVYTIAPFGRTAADVVDELRRRARAPGRPEPCHQRVWAERTRGIDGETCNGRPARFGRLAEAVGIRDPGSRKVAVCLLDGERALGDERAVWFPPAVGILDLFHVLGRLGQAAYCFHREGSPEAEVFVAGRLRMLLEGTVGYVIGGLRQMATKHGLKGAKRATLGRGIGYYERNRGPRR
jgi:hypothetical protein